MNPAFIFLVILGTVSLWFLSSFAYGIIGKFFYKIGKDAYDELNKESEESEE